MFASQKSWLWQMPEPVGCARLRSITSAISSGESHERHFLRGGSVMLDAQRLAHAFARVLHRGR